MAGVALYKIADDYSKAIDFDLDTEADAEALTVLLSEIQDRFENKAAAVVAYLRNIDAEGDAYKAEAARLVGEAQKRERRAKALRDYLTLEMRRCNLVECKAGLASLKFVNNPWRVELDPGVELPEDFLRRKPAPAPEPDKTKIAEALKAGTDIPGARLVQDERLKIV